MDHIIKHFGKYILLYLFVIGVCYGINAVNAYKSYKSDETCYSRIVGVVVPPVAVANVIANISK